MEAAAEAVEAIKEQSSLCAIRFSSRTCKVVVKSHSELMGRIYRALFTKVPQIQEFQEILI